MGNKVRVKLGAQVSRGCLIINFKDHVIRSRPPRTPNLNFCPPYFQPFESLHVHVELDHRWLVKIPIEIVF